jgi:hypothetical protein
VKETVALHSNYRITVIGGKKMAKRRRLLTVHRKGYHRKGYSRKGFTAVRDGHVKIPSAEVSPAYVPSATYKIKDIGAVGRGKKVIKGIKKGLLGKYGYATAKSAEERHRALRKADRAYGTVKLFKMLHAQVVMRKRIHPEARRVFEADRSWVKKNLLSKKEGLRMTARPRAKWKTMSPSARAKARK